jgi:hypothetical protein
LDIPDNPHDGHLLPPYAQYVALSFYSAGQAIRVAIAVRLRSKGVNRSSLEAARKEKVPLLQDFQERARQDSNLRPSLFVVRFFERDTVGYRVELRLYEELKRDKVRYGGIRFPSALPSNFPNLLLTLTAIGSFLWGLAQSIPGSSAISV